VSTTPTLGRYGAVSLAALSEPAGPLPWWSSRTMSSGATGHAARSCSRPSVALTMMVTRSAFPIFHNAEPQETGFSATTWIGHGEDTGYFTTIMTAPLPALVQYTAMSSTAMLVGSNWSAASWTASPPATGAFMTEPSRVVQ